MVYDCFPFSNYLISSLITFVFVKHDNMFTELITKTILIHLKYILPYGRDELHSIR